MDAVKRVTYPPSKRLVGIARQGSKRLIELGDLTAVVSMPWTPMMRVASLPFINRRQFVAVGVCTAWANDLETKGHKKAASKLKDLIAWAVGVDLEEMEVGGGRAA